MHIKERREVGNNILLQTPTLTKLSHALTRLGLSLRSQPHQRATHPRRLLYYLIRKAHYCSQAGKLDNNAAGPAVDDAPAFEDTVHRHAVLGPGALGELVSRARPGLGLAQDAHCKGGWELITC